MADNHSHNYSILLGGNLFVLEIVHRSYSSSSDGVILVFNVLVYIISYHFLTIFCEQLIE